MKLYISNTFLLLIFLSFFSCQSKVATKKKRDSTPNQETQTIIKPIRAIAYGIDISKYQGNEVDLLNKKKDSLSFIICKATEGINYTDPKFSQNWQLITSQNFIKGAYHFYRCQEDPVKQATYYSATIKTINNTDLPPIVDFEQSGIDASQSVQQIQTNLLVFLKEVEQKLDRKPMIYTNFFVANQYLSNAKFSQFPLWIADYTSLDKPMIPNTWKNKSWDFWQQKDTYRIDNISNDFDLFNGSSKQLKTFIKRTLVNN